ncbi:restriction endonuclease subunit S [Vibrio sp. MED222]|uniref:restriction endonuclease subunit S n=1 Tax=Vibrio sp. MED222 TaxID=314290 RepID=UPI000068A874|nr:restriction endonuclease subunit S [Vibrio sp. MED222]EAQ54718.1 type I restriction-modification system, S subunit [Vibrio sp. MED222]
MSDSPLTLVLDTEDWNVSNLSECSLFIKDGTHGTHKRTPTGIPLLSAKNVTASGKIKWDVNDSLVSEADYSKIHSKYELEKDDLLLTVVGTLGRRALVDGSAKFTIQRSVGVIRPDKNKVTPNFIFHFCGSDFFQNQLELRANATAQAGVYLGELAKVPVPSPPLPEQKKIAAILTSVDEVIEKTQAKIDKLKDLKTGMMQELLTCGVGVDGKPHTEFKDSPVGRVPKGWEVVELDRAAKVIDCKHATPKYFSNGFPVVKPGNIREGFLELRGCSLTDKAGFDNLNENHTPTIGDIIYSRNQTYGVGAYVNRSMEFCIGQDVCVISPKKCNSIFLFYMINSPLVKEQVELLAAGSTFKRINLGSIRKLKIALPCIEEQQAIGAVFESIDNKVSLLEKKLIKKKDTKKALMQDLLTGKKRVKVDS